MQTPVPARTNPAYTAIPMEPNRRPYTTERPQSLKTRGAEPPSLYDGTSTFTQIAKHNTHNCSSTCSLFVNTVHHTRTIAYVPNRVQCSLRSHMHTQQVECVSNDETLHTSTPQPKTHCTPAHATGALVTICRTALRIRSPPFQLRSLKQSQTNSKCSLEAVQTRSSQQCTRENDASVLHFQRCTSQVLLQPVSCSFPSTARRSHRMVPTSHLQLASSLLGRATILRFETSCCGGPYWTALPPGPRRCRGADAPQFSSRVRPAVGPSAGHRAASCCRRLQVTSPGLPGTRVGLRRGKVRACRSSLQSVKRSACSRCRSFTVLEEQY